MEYIRSLFELVLSISEAGNLLCYEQDIFSGGLEAF